MPLAPDISPSEKELVAKSMAFVGESKSAWTSLRERDFSVKSFSRVMEGSPSAWGKAVAVVHTSPEQALAFVWDFCSNLRVKEHQKADNNALRKFYDPADPGSMSSYNSSKPVRSAHIVVRKIIPGGIFLPRETSIKAVWDRVGEDSLCYAFEPAEVEYYDPKENDNDVVRHTPKMLSMGFLSRTKAKVAEHIPHYNSSKRLRSSRKNSLKKSARISELVVELEEEGKREEGGGGEWGEWGKGEEGGRAATATAAAATATAATATTTATTATTATATVTATAGEDNLEPTRMLGRMTIAKQKKKKCVQLKTTGLWLFKRLAKNVCEVTYVVNLIDKVSESHSVSARLDEDEHTRGGSCVLAADIMATSTTKLTHSIHIRLNRSFCSCLIKNAPHFARRRETFPLQSSTPTLTAR